MAFIDGSMKPRLETRHFSALVALADTGAISKAAQALGVAQSTLSETLLSLERSLQAPVLERQPGSAPTLTKAALRLLPHARSILRAMERAQIDALTSHLRIHVGATESLSTWVLPYIVEGFRPGHPSIEVQVSTDLCASLHRKLEQGHLDLIFTMEPSSGLPGRSPAPAAQFRRKSIRHVPLVVIGGPYISEAQLSVTSLTIHLPDPDGALHDVVERWASAWSHSARILSAGTMDAVRHNLSVGNGISVLPRYVVAAHLREGTLRMVKAPVAVPDMTVFATTSAEGVLHEPVESLCDQVATRLDELLADS